MYGCQIFGVGVKSEFRRDDDGRVIDGVKERKNRMRRLDENERRGNR